jgi:K+-transporting ATPase c subunit
MFKNKFKAYRFSIIACILCSLLTGLDYSLTRTSLTGIAFLISSIGSLAVITCYFIEKKKNK